MKKYFNTHKEAKEFMKALDAKGIDYDYGRKSIMGEIVYYVKF